MSDATDDYIRDTYAHGAYDTGFDTKDQARADFDDWLANHDREVAAKALEEVAADAPKSFGWIDPGDAVRAARWLSNRAAAIREGADRWPA